IRPSGQIVRIWNSPTNLFKEPMARLMYYDIPMLTEYAIWFDDDSHVESGWWDALRPRLDEKIDYLGQPWWRNSLAGQQEMAAAQPWYRHVPFEVRDGKPGVTFNTGGFLALRTERLYEANFPDTGATWNQESLKQYGGDTMLGEIARQLGWSRAIHDQCIKIN